MIQHAKAMMHDFISLIYPRVCAGCQQPLVRGEQTVCMACHHEIAWTDFHKQETNLLRTRFFGRLPLEFAGAIAYFSKGGIIQALLHQLKYEGREDVGEYLGNLYARRLIDEYTPFWDLILPVPLHPTKQRQRGYNQSASFARGLATSMEIEMDPQLLARVRNTESQTKKQKEDRWENVMGTFTVNDPLQIEGKHVLLVDDVVTTGATLESCGQTILDNGALTLSIATIAIAH